MDLFIPEDIKKISKILFNAGFECYLVGGAIRNQLLGKKAKDYDLTTNAKPEEVMKLFKKVIPTGIKHGTVTILVNKEGYEITTYRIDGKYTDGRRPDEIQFTPSIKEDLIRRDFTINSLAYNIEENKILDINNGINDLENRTIRAIGEPKKRFEEDALRLVRACRFASQLNFKIESRTYTAMSETLEKLPDVSKERISEELIKILKSSNPSIAFRHFYNCGMLKILFNDIYNASKKDYLAFTATLEDIDNLHTDKPYIKMARLLTMVEMSKHNKMLRDLKLSNNFIKDTIKINSSILLNLNTLDNLISIRQFISEIGVDYIDDIITAWDGLNNTDFNTLNRVKKDIYNELKLNRAFEIKDLLLNGKELISNLNLTPGPIVGNIFNYLLEQVLINPELNSKKTLLKLAKEFYIETE